MLPLLRDDALTTTDAGFAVRVSLPWIRSLPLASLADPAIAIDGQTVDDVRIALGDRPVLPEQLVAEPGWWFLQDRIVLVAGPPLTAGPHDVAVSFRLLIPYLPAGPDAPLALPFQAERSLDLDAAASVPSVSKDVA